MGGFVLDNENDMFEPDVNIKVVGVGGGGGNALNCMVVAGIKDVDSAHFTLTTFERWYNCEI